MASPSVENSPAFWEWLKNKVRHDNVDQQGPVPLELPVDDPSLIQPPSVEISVDDSTDDVDTEVKPEVVFQF